MMNKEFRAYDKKQKIMVYNEDFWLPKGLEKLGHKEYPVNITNNGIHYTLDCMSNHYEDEWDEDVVTSYDIEIMESTNYHDCEEPKRKIYSKDIISFYLIDKIYDSKAQRKIGKIAFSEQFADWIIVDNEEQFIEMLSKIEQPKVVGNWLDNSILLN
ncbi:MAG: YopX family protein [Eubacteriales bacterium]